MLIRVARDHATDPRAAGEALSEIARARLYRLDRHASFAAFVQAELGISRSTANRIRAKASRRNPPRSPERREAETRASEVRGWLRALDLRGARVKVGAWRGAPSIEIVLRPREVARLRIERRRE